MDEVKAMAQAGESVGKAVRTIRRNATEQAHKGATAAEHMLAEVDELVKQSRKARRKTRKDAAKATKKVAEQTRKRGRKARKRAAASTAEFSRKVQKKLNKLEHKTAKVRRKAEKNPSGKRGGRRLLWLLGAGSVAAVAVVVVKSRQSAAPEQTAPVIPLGGDTQSSNGSAPSNSPHAAEKN
jgi:ATPase subunit of ABC transporter with duplicated ATPase domains